MTTNYIVMGTVGEYSDRDEWPVASYTDREDAKTHVMKAEAQSRVTFIFQRKSREAGGSYEDIQALTVNEFDPGFRNDSYYSSCATYFIYEAPTEGKHIDAATQGKYECCKINWRGDSGYWWPCHADDCPTKVDPEAFSRSA